MSLGNPESVRDVIGPSVRNVLGQYPRDFRLHLEAICAIQTFEMPRRLKNPVQLMLPNTQGRGGRRKGAGRPRSKDMVSRRTRPTLNWRYPLHVVLRLRHDVGRLRNVVRFKHMKRAFRDGCQRFGLRMCDFSVQDGHIHLLVEADSKQALSRGMQALEIRLAWRINLTRANPGRVFADRYYARPLRTRAEVINALQYVRYNWHKHRAQQRLFVDWREIDPFSTLSGDAQWYDEETKTIAEPRTWLLTHVPQELLNAALRRLMRT